MNLSYTGRLSRARAGVATLAASLALAGVVEVAAPAGAAAMMRRQDYCTQLGDAVNYWLDMGVESEARNYYAEGHAVGCW